VYVLKYFCGGTIYMISNQILQSTIDGLKKISRIDFSILDTDGKCLVTTISSGAREQGSSVSSEGYTGAKKNGVET
jgi:hypothetical protein